MLDIDKITAEMQTDEWKAWEKEADELFFLKIKKVDAHNKRWKNKFVEFLKDLTDGQLSYYYAKFEKHEEKRKEVLYKRYVDGQTSLFEPLMSAMAKLGKKTKNKHYGDFTSSMYDWNGFRIELYCGQGCFNRLSRIADKN